MSHYTHISSEPSSTNTQTNRAKVEALNCLSNRSKELSSLSSYRVVCFTFVKYRDDLRFNRINELNLRSWQTVLSTPVCRKFPALQEFFEIKCFRLTLATNCFRCSIIAVCIAFCPQLHSERWRSQCGCHGCPDKPKIQVGGIRHPQNG